jgi:hypothetical protein
LGLVVLQAVLEHSGKQLKAKCRISGVKIMRGLDECVIDIHYFWWRGNLADCANFVNSGQDSERVFNFSVVFANGMLVSCFVGAVRVVIV